MLQEKYPGYHPLVSILEIANDPEADMRLQLECHKAIVKYVAPSLQAVSHEVVRAAPVVNISMYEQSSEFLENNKVYDAAAQSLIAYDDVEVEVIRPSTRELVN